MPWIHVERVKPLDLMVYGVPCEGGSAARASDLGTMLLVLGRQLASGRLADSRMNLLRSGPLRNPLLCGRQGRGLRAQVARSDFEPAEV